MAGREERFGDHVGRPGDTLGHADRRGPLRAYCTRSSREKGAVEQLYTAAPAGSVVVCLDEMGPQAAESHPGRRLVEPAGPVAGRAGQEIDCGRRGTAGYLFGALRPASGAALTLTHGRRTTADRIDFLGAVERWIDPSV